MGHCKIIHEINSICMIVKNIFYIKEEGKLIHIKDLIKVTNEQQKKYGTYATLVNSTTATVLQVCTFTLLFILLY